MDGVIVDLLNPLLQLLGLNELPGFYANRGFSDLTGAQLWGGTDADWWANLPWTQDGKEIVKICENAVGPENVIICTTPANWFGSAEGKLCWIANNLPDYNRRFILTTHKAACANAHTLLIDDNEDNIRDFKEAGGATLLCPRYWNVLKGRKAPFYLQTQIEDMIQ